MSMIEDINKTFYIQMSVNTYTREVLFVDATVERRRPYVRVPDGSYNPAALNLFGFPMCTRIYIGFCGIFDKSPKERVHNWGLGEIAHAHEAERCMCLRDGVYVWAGEGKIDDVILHEYAHILVGRLHDHDIVWVNKAKALGVTNPGAVSNYIYTGDPLVEWKEPNIAIKFVQVLKTAAVRV